MFSGDVDKREKKGLDGRQIIVGSSEAASFMEVEKLIFFVKPAFHFKPSFFLSFFFGESVIYVLILALYLFFVCFLLLFVFVFFGEVWKHVYISFL